VQQVKGNRVEVLWRAKRKDNGKYQVGDLEINRAIDKYFVKYYDEVHKMYLLAEVDKSTRALNFEDMIDSEGTKIFASLSEDGKGGDNLVYPKWVGWGEPQNIIRASFTNKGMSLKTKDEYSFHWTYQDIKVTGIQE